MTKTKTPRDHVVKLYAQPSLLGRVTEETHSCYLGAYDGFTCGVKLLEHATRYTRVGALRVAAGYSHAAAERVS